MSDNNNTFICSDFSLSLSLAQPTIIIFDIKNMSDRTPANVAFAHSVVFTKIIFVVPNELLKYKKELGVRFTIESNPFTS